MLFVRFFCPFYTFKACKLDQKPICRFFFQVKLIKVNQIQAEANVNEKKATLLGLHKLTCQAGSSFRHCPIFTQFSNTCGWTWCLIVVVIVIIFERFLLFSAGFSLMIVQRQSWPPPHGSWSALPFPILT